MTDFASGPVAGRSSSLTAAANTAPANVPTTAPALRRRRATADAAVTVLRMAYAETLAEPLPDRLAALLRQLDVPR